MLSIIIILFIGGTLALVMEAYLPGGILGLFGVAAVFASAGLLFFSPDFQSVNPALRFVGSLAILITSGAAAWFAISHFHRTPMGKALTLENENESAAPPSSLESLAGATGTALTELLPGGKAQIGSLKADVQSEVGAISEGSAVLVTRVEGSIVYVVPKG